MRIRGLQKNITDFAPNLKALGQSAAIAALTVRGYNENRRRT